MALRAGRCLVIVAAALTLVRSAPPSVVRDETDSERVAEAMHAFRSAVDGDVAAIMRAAPDGPVSEATSSLLHNLRTVSDHWEFDHPIANAHSFALTLRSDMASYRVVAIVTGKSGQLESIGAIPVAEKAAPARSTVVGYSIDRLTAGGCEHLRGAGPQTMPFASVAKLHLLAVLANRLEDSAVSLDDSVVIEPETRSLPSGTWQRLPTGTVRTVRDAARAAFAHSDNTAADLLLQAVGRDAMDAEAAASGMPGGYVSTSELFKLGWSDPALTAQVRHLPLAEQREVLAHTPLPSASRVESTPISDHSLGWRGRLSSVCGEWSVVLSSAFWSDIAPAASAVEFASIGCDDVAVKSGRGPGISSLSGVLDGADGQRIVVTVSVEAEGSEGDVEVWSAAQALAALSDRGVITCKGGEARVKQGLGG